MIEVARLLNAMRDDGVIRDTSMADVTELLRRQAEWQKSRAKLSWEEKLRLAELLRDAALAMRRNKPHNPP